MPDGSFLQRFVEFSAYSDMIDHLFAAFFKVVVAFCNKITLCSLFFWIQADF
ncbi:hypothetical protein AD10_2233 [Escherichia coli 1-182-04_S4_C2]|nr:hypothetical protein AD10_2233 [Escherichia coli 1-182-04_S4_C2]EZJ60805.1 hypothetical protein AC82_2332 [Escherichia coli 1-182-04_S4_C1]